MAKSELDPIQREVSRSVGVVLDSLDGTTIEASVTPGIVESVLNEGDFTLVSLQGAARIAGFTRASAYRVKDDLGLPPIPIIGSDRMVFLQRDFTTALEIRRNKAEILETLWQQHLRDQFGSQK